MRIGIFGGSFDPVHKEHTNFACAAIESLHLDKLIVMPAHIPPHKPGRTLSSDLDRLEMCRLAFSNVPKAEISDYEISKGGTSYTYLTCAHFKGKFPQADVFFLVGTDMLRDFPTWKEPQKILENATLAVCGRAEMGVWWEEEQRAFIAKFGKPFARVDYNGAKVSSTEIRVLAGAGMRLTEFLEEKVAAYIQEKGLYKIENAKEALSLEKPERQAHSVRVAKLAVARALSLRIPERKAIQAALFHDCGKYLSLDDPLLEGFSPPNDWGKVPDSVWHQFAGAFVAEHAFGITDLEVLDAIRYHTSGRENMGELEKLIFLSDMLEEERSYQGVEELRTLFWQGQGLDECLEEALFQTLEFLKEKKAEIYPLTKQAYEYYRKRKDNYGTDNE